MFIYQNQYIKNNILTKRYKPAASYRLKEVPIKQIMVWGEVQARKLDREGIADLAKSIKSEGLQNPPMVQKNGKNSYLLMAGQRRLAAMKRLRAKKIPVLILTRDSQHDVDDAKAVSVVENLHRKNMDARQMAESCQFLTERMGKLKAAKALGIKTQTLRKYLGFAAIPNAVKELVPKTISKTDAIRICKTITNVSDAIDTAQTISKYGLSAKKRYLDALEQLGPNTSHSEILHLANRFRARQNISMKLSKRQAKGLVRISSEKNMEPPEFAQKIVSDYLGRRGY